MFHDAGASKTGCSSPVELFLPILSSWPEIDLSPLHLRLQCLSGEKSGLERASSRLSPTSYRGQVYSKRGDGLCETTGTGQSLLYFSTSTYIYSVFVLL